MLKRGVLRQDKVLVFLVGVFFWGLVFGTGGVLANTISYMPEKLPRIQEKPAIVLCAFGTSTKAKITFDVLEKKIRHQFPGYEIRWAFTSDIIREKLNHIYAKRGLHKRLYSLQEVLAKLQAQGYRKVVVQPLHIFPGLEYDKVLEICQQFPDLRIVVGEPLLARWEHIYELLNIVSKYFLTPKEGINVIVAHGTNVTTNGANITYLGFDWIVRHTYPNVIVGTVEGVPSAEAILQEAKKYPGKRVRFIPFMFVGGDHIMHDIMGQDLEGGEKSWRERVESAGKIADCPTIKINGQIYYKGLGLYPEVENLFIESIKRCLEIMNKS